MAENQFPSTVDALFKGMDHFITSKTVVGEPVKVDENTTIIPLVDVTCGMAAGSFAQSAKTNGGGGMSAKMSPSAILVIQNGMTKLVNIKHQDAVITSSSRTSVGATDSPSASSVFASAVLIAFN